MLAFLIIPVGPYVCLYRSGALTIAKTITWSVFTLAVIEAHVTAMIFTEGRPEIQGWVLLSMVQCMTLVAVHQYSLGKRLSLWPRSGLRVWRITAKLTCGCMVLLLVGQLVRVIHSAQFAN